jgi:hypothetical protein
MEREALVYTINHLFLPPKLPQEDDSADYSHQRAALLHISQCADAFCDKLKLENAEKRVQTSWGVLQKTLATFASIHEASRIDQSYLEGRINAMKQRGTCFFKRVFAVAEDSPQMLYAFTYLLKTRESSCARASHT